MVSCALGTFTSFTETNPKHDKYMTLSLANFLYQCLSSEADCGPLHSTTDVWIFSFICPSADCTTASPQAMTFISVSLSLFCSPATGQQIYPRAAQVQVQCDCVGAGGREAH